MFKKAIVFADIHFGKKGNSSTFNRDCLSYIEWLCDKGKELKAETCIFLGDWHHDRKYVNTKTLKESIKAIERISETFNVVIVLLGNHDLYYRDKTDVHSLEFMKKYNNVCVIEEPIDIDDCCFFPWFAGNEANTIRKWKGKYVFGHFEIKNFLMNSMNKCDDENALTEDDFSNYEFVLSGHFHKRQNRKNIWYIGNTFPHDYSDADDSERGFCFLEYGKVPAFYNWPDQPTYCQIELSKLIESSRIEEILKPKTHAKIILDMDISYEETLKLREYFIEELKCREIRFLPKEIEIIEQTQEIEGNCIKTVDEIVVESLKSIESPSINTDLLIQIYRNLEKSE